MIINKENYDRRVEFSEVPIGSVFCASRVDTFYIKTQLYNGMNAVRLHDGSHHSFESSARVTVVDHELIIK